MKTATIPSLRVAPELREAVENILEENETLSKFVEEAIRTQLEKRQAQTAFLERALVSRDNARKTGQYIAAEDAIARLETILERAESKN